jgi:hypothetical protein
MMRKKHNPNDMTTWTKAQLIHYAKMEHDRAEAYYKSIERKNREFNELLAEARRRTIPYRPQSGHCYLDRVEPGLTVNILPKQVISIQLEKRRASSSIMNARWMVIVEGEVVVNIEGKSMSPILAEIEIQKRIDAKTRDASAVTPQDEALLTALDSINLHGKV